MASRLGQTLIKYSITTLVVSMTLVTFCLGLMTWYGAHTGGLAWSAGSGRASQALLSYLQYDWDRRGRSLALDTQSSILKKLEPNEVAFVLPKDRPAQFLRGLPAASWTRHLESSGISELTSSGYYRFGEIFVYIVVEDYVALGSGDARLLLVRHLDPREFLNAFVATTNAEIVLLSKTEVVSTTLLNIDGQTPDVKFTPSTLTQIRALPAGSFYNGVTELEAPHYAGYTVPTDVGRSPPYHRGEDKFKVYFSFFPLQNADGFTAAFLGVIVPEDALLSGVQKGLWSAFILMVALTSLSGLAFSKLSRKLTDPLAVTTQRLNQLSRVLAESLQIEVELDHYASDKDPSKIKEIAKLQETTLRLEDIFYKAEEIRMTIDDERAKSFTASKMASLGEISAGIAHEINTPLAAISMLAGQIHSLIEEDDVDDPKAISDLAIRIEDTTFKISKIIKGLQSYSRDAGNDPLTLSCLSHIIDDSLSLCSDALRQRSIQMKLNSISPDLTISCRPAQISQVLLNLINNAKDAIEDQPNPWIEISAEETEGSVNIRVTDSGQGVCQELKEKLFLPFFTTKPIGKGTGLGLSVSEKLIKAHGGKLELDGRSTNTCFVITLPKVTANTEALAA